MTTEETRPFKDWGPILDQTIHREPLVIDASPEVFQRREDRLQELVAEQVAIYNEKHGEVLAYTLLQLDITETEEAIAGYIRYLTRPLKVVGRGAIATTPVTDDGSGGKFVLILVTVPHAGRVQ